jgi:hypothetical protein
MIGRATFRCVSEPMPAQKGQLRKNFIAILSDSSEEQHAVEPPATSDRAMKDYVLGLIAVVRNLRRTAR